MFIAAVIVWCASGLSEPSDIADATKRFTMLDPDSISSSAQLRARRTNLQQIAQHRRLTRDDALRIDLERSR